MLDQVRERLRVKHYSYRTEEQYVPWIRRFILFHGKRHPCEMGAPEVEAFLTHLAVVGKVSASTQNQAKAAILFLYREVLAGVNWLVASLLYGAGLRLMECARLRVKDVDFRPRGDSHPRRQGFHGSSDDAAG